MLSDDRNMSTNDETLSERTPLITQSEPVYRYIRTTPVIISHILLVITFEMVMVLIPFLCYDKKVAEICKNHSPYNILLCLHAGSYVVSVAFDCLYAYYHNESRRDGYLEFYRRTRNLRHVPLITITTGNAILVATIKLVEDNQSTSLPLQPWHCLLILTTLEVIIILCVLSWYLSMTIRFNKQHTPPDATLNDLTSTFSDLQTSVNEIGFRDATYTSSILEKQADLIQYLNERNHHLTRLLHRYEQQINPRQTTINTA